MRELAERAINLLQLRGAHYGDFRVVEAVDESIEVKNGRTENVVLGRDLGFGVRVLLNGAWGFAASSRLEGDEIDRVVGRAIQVAQASAKLKAHEVTLAQADPIIASYKTPVEKDPLAVPLEEKMDLLGRADKLLGHQKSVELSQAFMDSCRTKKLFANTEGSMIEQEIVECGAGIAATAIAGDDLQVRSYPNSFRGNFATAGYEYVKSLDLVGHAERVADEACQLLSAPPCPAGTTTVVLDGGQLGLQVHESIGHPIELDRVLGTEASYAGTSFLTLDKLGDLRYGSDIVNVVADATVPMGLGTFGYDDEGVPAQKSDIIRDGRFVGYLTSRETAPTLGASSNGTMRADGWSHIPLVRMTNINLRPGDWDFDDLIADTTDGLYLETNRSWSIDDKRLNFQFATEVAWQIKDGKRGTMYKNPTYTGLTPEFWNSCDAICNEKHWRLWGTPNCGKGEPGQTAHVGHGVAPARFRNVTVGVMQ